MRKNHANCPGPLMMTVHVVVQCPVDTKSLNKKGIRSRKVRIAGVGWDQARFFCPTCGWVQSGT